MDEPYRILSEWREGAGLLAPERAWCSDATLRRYAAARPTNAHAALSMLKATLEWRRSAVAPPLHCPRCDAGRASHCFVPIGKYDGSVFIYGCPARAADPDVEATVRHVVHCLEHAFDDGGCEQWTWLVDFKGFGLTHALQARLGAAFARLFADHFPERLRRLYLINTPTIFQLLLAAIEPFADARTMSKIVRVAGAPAAVAAELAAGGLPAAQCAWIGQVLDMAATPGVLPPLPPGSGALMPRSLIVGLDPDVIKAAVDVWPEQTP